MEQKFTWYNHMQECVDVLVPDSMLAKAVHAMSVAECHPLPQELQHAFNACAKVFFALIL